MAIHSPFGFIQETSTILATVMRENWAICRTRGPLDVFGTLTAGKGDDLVY
jgi:hypothetical protein